MKKWNGTQASPALNRGGEKGAPQDSDGNGAGSSAAQFDGAYVPETWRKASPSLTDLAREAAEAEEKRRAYRSNHALGRDGLSGHAIIAAALVIVSVAVIAWAGSRALAGGEGQMDRWNENIVRAAGE